MPTHNNVCVTLVEKLHRQCEKLAQEAANGFAYEIVVADDGSTDERSKARNRDINAIEHCRFIERETNVGRSRIRNFLAKESRGEWLLFLDSDVDVRHDSFVGLYLDSQASTVAYGGVRLKKNSAALHNNLRFRYEQAEAYKHSVWARLRSEHKSFRTTNFMVRRDIMLDNPFDETITAYGYEDVLFGKCLCERNIPVAHIDNPVILVDFEPNTLFVEKTEESLRTLFQHRQDLAGYSTLLDGVGKMERWGLLKAMMLWHKIAGGMERRNLTGYNPSLLAYKLYKMGYYISLSNTKTTLL